MEMVQLAKADAQKILDYLVSRPFAEVHQYVTFLTSAKTVAPAGANGLAMDANQEAPAANAEAPAHVQ